MGHPGPARKVVVAACVSVALLLAQLITGPAEAGPRRGMRDRAVKLSLAEAVATAQQRNLRLVDARLEIQEQEQERRKAYSDFFPTVDLQYVARFNRYRQSGNVLGFASSQDSRRPVAPGVSPLNPDAYPYRIDPYDSFSVVGTLTQPVYNGGELVNNYKYARLGVDYSEIQHDVDRQDLILEVHEAYYQLVQSYKLLNVAKQSILALESLRNQTVEFFKAGVVPKVDVLSTEGQLAQARIQRTQAEADIQRYEAQLLNLLRYPQETPVRVDQEIGYIPSPFRIPLVYSIAAGNRSEIKQADISMEQAMALLKASHAGLLPSISVQVQGSRTNDDWNAFDKEGINDWSLQGVMTWSFDMFRTRSTVKERRAFHSRAYVARQQLVEQIMLSVKQAYADMKRAEKDIANNRKAVEFRKENFRINKERYNEQVATYTEVLDAQRELAQAQGDYYISLIGYRINKAVLEREMGILR